MTDELLKPEDLTPASSLANEILADLDRILLGRSDLHRLVLAGILSRGHILLEGVPGDHSWGAATVISWWNSNWPPAAIAAPAWEDPANEPPGARMRVCNVTSWSVLRSFSTRVRTLTVAASAEISGVVM